jgi:hypothetical protein
MEKKLADEWREIEKMVYRRFGEKLGEQTILFIIGLQELGMTDTNLKKEEKLDVIHIGICTVLSKYGYYKFIGKDDDGWPHYKSIKKLPNTMQGESQELLIKKAIIDYFNI